MKGFILRTQPCREEDLIVTILSPDQVGSYYRFYGARHSVIQLGYKVDFTREQDVKSTIPRLRNVLHLGYSWLFDAVKMRYWQRFMQLLEQHFRGTETVESFYYELLEKAALQMERQEPRRVLVESYIHLLEYEGRLHLEPHCFLCDDVIEEEPVALARAFLPAHEGCLYTTGFTWEKVEELLVQKRTVLFEEEEIQRLWSLLDQGL